MNLKDKRILIFISGAIAAYKILYLIRMIKKEGGFVRVVATKKALSFIGVTTLEALSEDRVLSDRSECWSSGLNHIQYAKWAELALFAPLTMNSLAKLSSGIADNVYLSTALALTTKKKLVAPCANTFMIENPISMANLDKLSSFGFEIISPIEGLLACGDYGSGAMEGEGEILSRMKRAFFRDDFWNDKRVIITGGGSSEEIDDIRCISNNSSGLQASSLAVALFYLGARVSFISSKFPITLPNAIKKIYVKSSKDYLDALQKEILQNELDIQSLENFSDSKNVNKNEKFYLFMAAAISDFIIEKTNGKIKKENIDNLNLSLSKNIDILGSIDSKYLIKIGFKAECLSFDELEDDKISKNIAFNNARKMLDSKNCAAVCLNIITKNHVVFGSNNNSISIFSKDKKALFNGNKLEVSLKIAQFIKNL